MGIKCGIVGLPNVGKSTLFNALTESAAAEAANYPFCTIEPNVGRVSVPDTRLDQIASTAKSAKTIPTQIEFVDIAGLVRGASKGEGLGNQFLSHIREVDAVIHVLRCFEDGDITHVEGRIDPLADAATVETELMLADLDSLEKRLPALQKKAKSGDKEADAQRAVMEPAIAALQAGKPARTVVRDLAPEQRVLFRQQQLLTGKPVLYACNVEESSADKGNALSARVAAHAKTEGAEAVVISAKIESELAVIADPAERQEYLAAMGLAEPGLHRLIRSAYRLLGLITFFTAGPKETRAWTVRNGAAAPEAAGVIHTDFERGFIRAETMDYESFVSLGGEAACRDAGKLRQEGKDYAVKDGDILHFKFNV